MLLVGLRLAARRVANELTQPERPLRACPMQQRGGRLVRKGGAVAPTVFHHSERDKLNRSAMIFSEMTLESISPPTTAMMFASMCAAMAPTMTPVMLCCVASASVANMDRSPHSATNIIVNVCHTAPHHSVRSSKQVFFSSSDTRSFQSSLSTYFKKEARDRCGTL